MKTALKILLFLISTLSYSQNECENEVFKTIIKNEIKKNKTTFYIQCEKSHTPFSIEEFREDTVGFEVSEVTLKEFEKNNIETNEFWNQELLNKLDSNSTYYKNCLTKKEIELLFKNSDKAQNIISIGKPIFDNKFENCILSISHSRHFGSAYGKSCFLKKVSGIWTIVFEFGHWMS